MAGRAIQIHDTFSAAGGEVVLVPARFRDLPTLRTLQRRCFSSSQAYGLATLFVLYLWPRCEALVARSGDRIVGSVFADVMRGQARILNICVDPDFRREGIGARLLAAAESLFDVPDITLMVEDKNTGAQELYRRSGYLTVGQLPHYYGRNRHGLLMQKRRGVPPDGPSASVR